MTATIRSALGKILILVTLLVVLLPALVYLTSPWWAPGACRWAASRFWKTELKLATATLNPFTLRLEGAGGTFQAPPARGYKASGDISRVSIRVDAFPLVFEHRIRRLNLDLASLTVILTEEVKGLPLSSLEPAAGGGIEVLTAADVADGVRERPWMVERLRLKIDRGVLRYSQAGRQGEISMDLNFKSNYENVGDVKTVAANVVQDFISKAAYGFMTQKLFK